MSWITHEDGCLDLGNGRCLDGHCGVGDTLVGIATTTEGIVEDLSTLIDLSVLIQGSDSAMNIPESTQQ